ncbi:MAG: hypothetical protein ACFFC1_14840, partial [Promethearchaeota archaeon]
CQFSKTNVKIKNSVFQNVKSWGGRINQTPGRLSNLLVKNSETGFIIDGSTITNLERSIFYNNVNDCEIFALDSIFIHNNVFTKSNVNITLIEVKGMISNNIFQYSNENIGISNISNIEIIFNEFKNNQQNIILRSLSHQTYQVITGVNKNNFFKTVDYVIELEPKSAKEDVNAKLNYWGTVYSSEIEEKIYDKNDFFMNTMKFVNYDPFYDVMIDSAGLLIK